MTTQIFQTEFPDISLITLEFPNFF